MISKEWDGLPRLAVLRIRIRINNSNSGYDLWIV